MPDLRKDEASGVKQVACGYKHTIIRLVDGRVLGTGLNDNGQLSKALPMEMVNTFTEIEELN